MLVLATEEEDGVATVSVCGEEEDHKFEVWSEGGEAFVEYQETQSWRGQIRVAEPDEEIYKRLMVSDEVTRLLDEWAVESIRRAEPTP